VDHLDQEALDEVLRERQQILAMPDEDDPDRGGPAGDA
jgi:hypothetical protein